MSSQMLELEYHQIDAFTDRVFGGNPAAVYVLDRWLGDRTLQAIAAEHNLSETAFVVPGDKHHELRWFTPTCEVALCGHATLATAHVLLRCDRGLGGFDSPLRFSTRRAGIVHVFEEAGLLWLDFPAQSVTADVPPQALCDALGAQPATWYNGPNHLAVFDDAQAIVRLTPDMNALAQQAAKDNRGVIVTAPASDGTHDFVSRYFAPGHGVPEDPVTGSAHCMLAPYWSERLSRDSVSGFQASSRGGTVACRMKSDRVHLGGQAVRYARGQSRIPATERSQ